MKPPGKIAGQSPKPGAEVQAEALVGSPAWFPLESAGAGALRLVRLDEDSYRRASFLDRRLLKADPEQAACDYTVAAAAASRLSLRAHYIFHIGHVGSTLLSRLIGASPGFFSLREPAILREIATRPKPGGGGSSLEVLLPLLCRTWRPEQRALIKATSFVSELAEPILRTDETAAAIFMFTRPVTYLCGILAGSNSRREARILAPARLERLRLRLSETAPPLEPRAEGEWIAMSWLCEMATLSQAAGQLGSRILWLDFDAFLAAPAEGLCRAFRMLGASLQPRDAGALLSGPLMRQYSKAPEHAYDPALRRSVLESAQREHAGEIRRGIDWLRRLAARHPLIDQALCR